MQHRVLCQVDGEMALYSLWEPQPLRPTNSIILPRFGSLMGLAEGGSVFHKVQGIRKHLKMAL